jgi:hypothetical protein
MSQYGLPLLVESLTANTAQGLTRVRFEKGDGEGFSEKWLQRLISRYPTILPINQIEPALTPAIPVCMELPLPSGYLDNLFVTPLGHLIVGETKLYRNPEARREVVGQIIDYAKDLSTFSYSQLNESIARADRPDGERGRPGAGLYEAVVASLGAEAPPEEEFVDAVQRNLQRGRMLLLVIGDGIQTAVESISEFLQQHAGMHFTFGLIELAVLGLPGGDGGYVVQPRVLGRTTNIERGIVTIEDGRIMTRPPVDRSAQMRPGTARSSITEEEFYERLSEDYAAYIPQLKAFVNRLATLGVVPEFGKGSMKLRWRQDEDHGWNLGSILTSGKVWTEQINSTADSIGRIDLSHAYLRELAAAIPNASVRESPKQTNWFVAKSGTYVTINELLNQQDAWEAAIKRFMTAAIEALKGL